MGSGYCGLDSGNDFLDTISLLANGTYTFRITPQSGTSGNLAVSVNNDQDVTTPGISIGGSAVTATTTAAGQDVRLSFSATAAQYVAVGATNVTTPVLP